MARPAREPSIGDIFTRQGMFPKDYEVTDVYVRDGHLPHARMTNVGDRLETITVAAAVLHDDRFFRPSGIRRGQAA